VAGVGGPCLKATNALSLRSWPSPQRRSLSRHTQGRPLGPLSFTDITQAKVSIQGGFDPNKNTPFTVC
jgi:hypothetical protein